MTNFLILSAVALSSFAFAARTVDTPLEQKVDQIVSIFENETPEIQYDYIEALPDGRGYTAGRAGFTTATGDLLEVVEDYKGTLFDPLLPRLRELSASKSGSLVGLETLPDIWKAASEDSEFLRVQDEVTETAYKEPARDWCRKLALQSPLSYLIIYDSIIQHGNGTDGDSLGALIAKTHARSEHEFINQFLAARRADLLNPTDPETQDEWRESVGRVDALQQLVNENNWQLSAPLRVHVWGRDWAI
jgi:chitosanase